MKAPSYLNLRKEYIDRSKRRLDQVTQELERLSKALPRSPANEQVDLEELVQELLLCSGLLRSNLQTLERMPLELWEWTAYISDIEDLWKPINNRLILIRDSFGGEAAPQQGRRLEHESSDSEIDETATRLTMQFDRT